MGQPDEIRGFALAGVETVPCHTAEDARAIFSELVLDRSHVGVIIASAWVNQVAAASVARAREQRDAPVVVVLPLMDGASNGSWSST